MTGRAWVVHWNRRMIGVGGYQAWALRRPHRPPLLA
jgi:hypothetical protein